MLKVKDIVLVDTYGKGFACTVKFQIGDLSYNTVAVPLPPDAVREIVSLAVERATVMLAVLPDDIRVEGDIPPLADLTAAADGAFAPAPTAEALNPEEQF